MDDSYKNFDSHIKVSVIQMITKLDALQRVKKKKKYIDIV